MVCNRCSIHKRAVAATAVAVAIAAAATIAAAADVVVAATFQTIIVKLAPSVLEIIQHGFRWLDEIDRCRLVYWIV